MKSAAALFRRSLFVLVLAIFGAGFLAGTIYHRSRKHKINLAEPIPFMPTNFTTNK